jgi:hypothetical protein
MALIHMLMRLKNEGVVTRFDMIGSQKARARLSNEESIILCMPDDYIIGDTAIREAVGSNTHPEYIVYNDWSNVTESALAQARKLNIPLIKFGRLRYILDERLGKEI